MADQHEEQTYGDDRRRELERMLRHLADRIRELDAAGPGQMLAQAGELMKLIGDVRSELFHYEVRITYDTPEVADNRRIVGEAQRSAEGVEQTWEKTDWDPARDDDSREW